MNSLAKRRRAKRFESGALSLNTPKLTFKLDDNGNPADFGSYPIRDSNKLVEVRIGISFPTRTVSHFSHIGRIVHSFRSDWKTLSYIMLRLSVRQSLQRMHSRRPVDQNLQQGVHRWPSYYRRLLRPSSQEFMLLANFLVAQQVRSFSFENTEYRGMRSVCVCVRSLTTHDLIQHSRLPF